MAEEKEEVVDKKAEEKQRKKEEAKQKKAQHAAESDELEEESGGSKVAVFFVSLLIIVVWFAIIALLIKWDVGGFGSGVLAPILKDVPYVNKILPDDAVEQVSTEDSAYAYDTMADAVERIKELEKELADAQNASSANADYISQLEAQSQELQQYKQVVAQTAEDEQLDDYIKTYSSMKPKEAAAIFDTMTDNLKLVAQILDGMDADSRAAILGKMTSDTAAKVTEIMKPSE